MNEYNWKIEHQCPQCGAPVVLDEADHLLFCPFCRTKLYLTTPDHFRYHLPVTAGDTSEMVYAPYWRLKGNSFSVYANEVFPRFIDTNVLAADSIRLPVSLGLRPQAMNIKFITPDMPGRFLKADLPVNALMNHISASGAAVMPAHTLFYRAFIGEMISLIYSPAYVEKNALYDVFTKKWLAPWRPEDIQATPSDATPPNRQIHFVSTLCPQCGWDLEGEKDAWVMICRNCDSAWYCHHDAFAAMPFTVIPAPGKEAVIHLPFWRMQSRWEGVSLTSYADLIRMANLPRAVQTADQSEPPYFWAPAFKVNPALFMRLARQMTALQPRIDVNESFSNALLHRVSLSREEAVESMVVTLANIVTDKRRLYPELSNIKGSADSALLVYQPFKITLREFIHVTVPMAIARQAVNLGTHI